MRRLFSKVPATYELVNHILTFGLDTAWRRRAARLAAESGGARWLDVCTGTGQMAVYLSQLASDGTHVHATDYSLPMLSEAVAKHCGKDVRFTLSDVRDLPFSDGTFNLVTISFATRNIDLDRRTLVQCFTEFHRVLKSGGCFVNLETTQPSSAAVRRLFHLYVRLFVAPVGGFVSGFRPAYACLSRTIRGFYRAEELEDLLRLSGFERVECTRLFPGAAAIHRGYKSINVGGSGPG